MLRYLGSGRRRFGTHPMYVHRRANWEFFAVLHGRCGSLQPETRRAPLLSRHLWIFPPETAHGWSGERNRPCQVAIFHFGSVPELLAQAVRREGRLSIALTPAQALDVRRLAAELLPHYQRITERSYLVFDRALLSLTLLALEHIPASQSEEQSDFARRKVKAALAWYGEHLTERPKLDRVAQATHVSGRHLRRLFREARGESPHAAFARVRVHRAMDLLARSDLKLDAVAAASGFASVVDLCRVFSAHQKVSPGAWRKRVMRGCNEAGPANPSVVK